VRSLGAGEYCIAVAGIDPAQSIAIVAPEFGHDATTPGSPGIRTIVEYNANSGGIGCLANEFAVLTYVDTGTTMSLANAGFTFLVP
jgi:hypothetical protein